MNARITIATERMQPATVPMKISKGVDANMIAVTMHAGSSENATTNPRICVAVATAEVETKAGPGLAGEKDMGESVLDVGEIRFSLAAQPPVCWQTRYRYISQTTMLFRNL